MAVSLSISADFSTVCVKNTFLEIEQPGHIAAGTRSKSAEPQTTRKALSFEPSPRNKSPIPEDMSVAAPSEHPGGNPEDAPHPDANTGSHRRQRRRRGRKVPVLFSHSSASALMANVEQAAKIQQVFDVAACSDAPLSFKTIVDVLHAAAKLQDNRRCAPCPGGVQSLPGFQRCMYELRRMLDCLNLAGPQRSCLPKLFWSLGKLDVGIGHASFFLERATRLLPGNVNDMHRFSTPEIVTCLYGLAKLVTTRTRTRYDGLARLFVAELNDRMDKFASSQSIAGSHKFSPQCIANSVYAVAQLQLQSHVAHNFVQACVSQIVDGRQDLTEFKTQGVANTIWALAKMPQGIIQKPSIKSLLHRARAGSEYRLREFMPQELSMFAWGMGKLVAAGGKDVRSFGSFIVYIASVAHHELHMFSPQSVSNVALALSYAGTLGNIEALSFIGAAATQGVEQIAQWQPQAISNFSYVLGQLPGVDRRKRGTAVANIQQILPSVRRFAKVASVEAECRMNKWNWQDLSGIISALGKGTLVSDETVSMVTKVLRAAPGRCHQMSTQSMLNITTTALELPISTLIVQPMYSDVARCIADRTPGNINNKDSAEWRKIQALFWSKTSR